MRAPPAPLALPLALATLLAALLAGCSGAGPEDGGAEGGAAAAPAPEAGIVTGRLTAAAAAQAVEMPVERAGHGRLAVTLVMATSAPENEMTVAVAGPDGRSAEGSTAPFLYVFPGTRPSMSFADPAVGTWTADVELAGGAAADFELHWCADSAAAKGPSSNLACQRH